MKNLEHFILARKISYIVIEILKKNQQNKTKEEEKFMIVLD